MRGSSDQAKPTLVRWLARWTGSDTPRLLRVEIVDPVGRIIVEPDRRLRRVADVDMMGQREIGEAHLSGHFGEGCVEVTLGTDFTCLSNERVYSIEHPPLRRTARSHGAFQVRLAHVPPF